jgi:hypothetical protein
LPQGVTSEDFTLTDTSDGYTPQGACEINGLTVTATKAGYIGVRATAKVGRTTYLAGFKGYVAETAPKITCNGVPLSGAIPVGAGEPLPSVRMWTDKAIPFKKGGPDGTFSYFKDEKDGVAIYRYSFDQFKLRQLKNDYIITVKAEYRDKPFNEIKVEYYETDISKGMLNYITAAEPYNKPDTSTLENFLKFKGVASGRRQLSGDDPLFTKKNVTGGKYIVIEADHSKLVQLAGDKYKSVPTELSIEWGLTSSMPMDQMVDFVNGAQYAILINIGKEYDGEYSYRDKTGRMGTVRYYQYFFTAELYDETTGKLVKMIYREDTSGTVKPEERLFVEAEERGGFIGGRDAARKKCRDAVMKYIYETMWH